MNATVKSARQKFQTFERPAHLGGQPPLSQPTAIHHRLRVVGRHLFFIGLALLLAGCRGNWIERGY
jgi:hypothetical protein